MPETLLIILAFVFIILGIIGSFLPVLPATPLAFLGLLIFKFSEQCNYSWWMIAVAAILTLITVILEYVIPIIGTKKFGGSKLGTLGSIIGLIVGIFFFPPFGIIIGPFVGAFIGELIKNQEDIKSAFKAALGSLVGFLLSTGINLAICILFAVVILYSIW